LGSIYLSGTKFSELLWHGRFAGNAI